MDGPLFLLFEVSPLVGGIPQTLRLASIDADKLALAAGNQRWLPCITQLPTISVTVADNGLVSSIAVSRGEIQFQCCDEFNNHEWSSYVWVGTAGADFPSYRKIFEGSVSALEREGNTVTVRLLGPEASITGDILTAEYAGTGGAEGPYDLKGKLKPRAYGSPKSVFPVEIDPVHLVYQVHGYGPVLSIQPYEFGSRQRASRAIARRTAR
jgi:hypothetical protein